MKLRKLKWPLVAVGTLAGAFLAAFLLGVLAPPPEQAEPPPSSPLVSTVPVETQTGSLHVRGTGTVQPIREIQLTAEVGGRLVSVSDALVNGGRFEAGETLARIAPSDYLSAVEQAEAQVTEARFQLIQTRQEAGAAREEYERIRDRTGRVPDPDSTALGRLVFNEPQVARAEANLKSARAALRTATTNLERTRLHVPFDGMVRRKQADLGAYLGPGTPVATVYGTDTAEIVVSLPTRKAALIRNLWSTTVQQTGDGPPATVIATYGGRDFSWQGRVHRVDGAINEQTRTVGVVVRVPDPYNQTTPPPLQPPDQPEGAGEVPGTRPPLAVGTFVQVDIEGRQQGTYQVVPRRAVHLREPGQAPVVWTAVGDSMLIERTVEPIQTVEEQTYLAPTLEAATRVITTNLRVHADSMRIRVAQ